MKHIVQDLISSIYERLEFLLFLLVVSAWQILDYQKEAKQVGLIYTALVLTASSTLGFVILQAFEYYQWDSFFSFLIGLIAFSSSNKILISVQENIKGIVKRVLELIPNFIAKAIGVKEKDNEEI